MSPKISRPHSDYGQKAAREDCAVGVKHSGAARDYDFPRLFQYLLAGCASLLVVFFIAVMPQPSVSRIGPTLLFAVVLVSSWYGGFGPGILAAFLAVAGTELLATAFVTPFPTRTADIVLMVMFTAVSYALSCIKRRRASGAQFLGVVAAGS